MSKLRCPAAREEHPILSRNEMDVQCGVNGRLLPAEGSPCCNEYTKCTIWQMACQSDEVSMQGRQRALLRSDPHQHELGGDLARETARV